MFAGPVGVELTTRQAMSLPIYARLLITLAVTGVIVLLSITPGDQQIDDNVFVWLVVITPTTLQKILHVVAYGGLAFLWAWTFHMALPRIGQMVLSLTLTIATGAALEWYQTTVPGRFGTLMDIVLNAAGAALGILAAILLL